MKKNKSRISKGGSYSEIGEYWDAHDLTEVWEETESVDFEVDIQYQRVYFPIDRELTDKIHRIARAHGITPETLVNLWIQEKANQSNSLDRIVS